MQNANSSRSSIGTLTQAELLSGASAFIPAVKKQKTPNPKSDTTGLCDESKLSTNQNKDTTLKSRQTTKTQGNDEESKNQQETIAAIEQTLSGRMSRADRYAALLKHKGRSISVRGKQLLLKENSSEESNKKKSQATGLTNSDSAYKHLARTQDENTHSDGSLLLMNANNVLSVPSRESRSMQRQNQAPKNNEQNTLDQRLGYVSRFNNIISSRTQNISSDHKSPSKMLGDHQQNIDNELEGHFASFVGGASWDKEAFEAGSRMLKSRCSKDCVDGNATDEKKKSLPLNTGKNQQPKMIKDMLNNSNQAIAGSSRTQNSIVSLSSSTPTKMNGGAFSVPHKKEKNIATTAASPSSHGNPAPSPQRSVFGRGRKSDQSGKSDAQSNRFQRNRHSDASTTQVETPFGSREKGFKYQALDSPGDESFSDWDYHGNKDSSPAVSRSRKDIPTPINSKAWLDSAFLGEWTVQDDPVETLSAEDDADNFRSTPDFIETTNEPDRAPSFGSMTVEDEEDVPPVSALRDYSPGRSVDVGDKKPMSPRSPKTPSKFQNVRSIFENASKNSPSPMSRFDKIPKQSGVRSVISPKKTETEKIDERSQENSRDSCEGHQAVSTGIKNDNREETDSIQNQWRTSQWINLSVEEKVMSSMDRLYNTNLAGKETAILQEAMNPFSLSTEYASGSFPSTFDETAMDTKSIEGETSEGLASHFPTEDPSLLSSFFGKGAITSMSRSIGQSAASDISNSMLHGEIYTEDGSALHYSSGSNNLKMSSDEKSARLSSATGNFFSSSSSQMSKSTISREEFLKSRTKSTTSSAEVERLAPIADDAKEDENGFGCDEKSDPKAEHEFKDVSKSNSHVCVTSSVTNGTQEFSQPQEENDFDPNPKADTLRWWQKKYAQNVAGPTNSVVKKAFSQKNEFRDVESDKDDEDVFSGLEEDPKTQDSSFEKALNDTTTSSGYQEGSSRKSENLAEVSNGTDGPSTMSAISLEGFDSVVPPPPPPAMQVPIPKPQNEEKNRLSKVGHTTPPRTPEGRKSRRSSFKKKVGTIVEVSESEMSDDVKPSESAKIHHSNPHSGKVIDGYEMDKVTSDITFSVIEGRDKRKATNTKDMFGKIDEVSEHQSHQDESFIASHQDSHSRSGLQSHLGSQLESDSRLGSHVDSRFESFSRFDDRAESDSRLDSRLDSRMGSQDEVIVAETESESVDKAVNSMMSESEDLGNEFEEDIDADTIDISYAESKEHKARSTIESTAEAVMSFGYAIFDSFAKACKITGKF